eukprot:SAG22_NODE_4471_length_1259_cov_2.287069_2_plen_109_part_00
MKKKSIIIQGNGSDVEPLETRNPALFKKLNMDKSREHTRLHAKPNGLLAVSAKQTAESFKRISAALWFRLICALYPRRPRWGTDSKRDRAARELLDKWREAQQAKRSK